THHGHARPTGPLATPRGRPDLGRRAVATREGAVGPVAGRQPQAVLGAVGARDDDVLGLVLAGFAGHPYQRIATGRARVWPRLRPGPRARPPGGARRSPARVLDRGAPVPADGTRDGLPRGVLAGVAVGRGRRRGRRRPRRAGREPRG